VKRLDLSKSVAQLIVVGVGIRGVMDASVAGWTEGDDVVVVVGTAVREPAVTPGAHCGRCERKLRTRAQEDVL
jgi:hypothetical protein